MRTKLSLRQNFPNFFVLFDILLIENPHPYPNPNTILFKFFKFNWIVYISEKGKKLPTWNFFKDFYDLM